jgi:hypothetical protein
MIFSVALIVLRDAGIRGIQQYAGSSSLAICFRMAIGLGNCS